MKKTDEILSELRQKTRVLETALDKIPPIYKNYKNVYPEQMTEIKEAIRKMKEERYEFEFDSEKVISETDDQIKRLDEGLAKIEVEDCELLDNKISDFHASNFDICSFSYSLLQFCDTSFHRLFPKYAQSCQAILCNRTFQTV